MFTRLFHKFRSFLSNRGAQAVHANALDDIVMAMLGAPDTDIERLEEALIDGIESTAKIAKIDAVSVAGVQATASHIIRPDFEWDNGHITPPSGLVDYDFNRVPGWLEKLAAGEIINSPFAAMPAHEQEFLNTKTQAVLVVPVVFRGHFWGIVVFEDHNLPKPFSHGRVALLKSAAVIIVSAVHRRTVALRLRSANTRASTMLNAMPNPCYVWGDNGGIIDANIAGVHFFGYNTHDELKERFPEVHPKLQSNGRKSSDLIPIYLSRAQANGWLRVEWDYIMPFTGELVPTEVDLVRMENGGETVVAGYVRDLREQKRLVNDLTHRGHLLSTINTSANTLLQSETAGFEPALFRSLSMMARVVDVQRVFVWEYVKMGKRSVFNQLYDWVGDQSVFARQDKIIDYGEDAALLIKRMQRGMAVSGKTAEMPEQARHTFLLEEARSFLLIPINLRGAMWGIVGFGDTKRERDFTKDEESILHTGGQLIANALLRNKMTLEAQENAAKLRAVLSNYTGIIWHIDRDERITLFDGLATKKLGIRTIDFVDKRLSELDTNRYDLHIAENARRTLVHGPQRWRIRYGETTLSARSMPVFDSEQELVGVVGSIEDVTDAVNMQEQLEHALVDAKAANDAKSRFLSTMSHEMRTPLNAIIGMTKLGQAAATDDRRDYAFEKIDAASSHLLNVINDVLDMSKIEAGMLVLATEAFELSRMIETVRIVNSFRVEEKMQSFTVGVGEGIPQILIADSHRLQQVLINLIGNAVKFTGEGKEIRLYVSLAERRGDKCTLQFDVEDEGIGLSEQQQENLFQSFVQAETHTARKYGGTGLGLAISKHLVQLMGGEIWVRSQPGCGATFSFTIPVQSAEPTELAGNTDTADETLYLPGKRILLAEDVEINREIVIAMLEDSGAEIVTAENGREAVHLYEEDPARFDLILMDIHMPLMDGYQATRNIRAIPHPAATAIPIIAMTANVFRDDVQRCMDVGMTAHLGKPLDFATVKATLRKYIGG